HHLPCKQYGIPDISNPCDGTSLQCFSIHKSCIHFVQTFFGKHRSPTSVEYFIVFQFNNCSRYCIQSCPTFRKHLIPCVQSFLESLSISLFSGCIHRTSMNITSPTVNN